MESAKDILAYLVHVGSRPIPFIAGGLVATLLNDHLQSFADGMTAIALTGLAVGGISLMVLPPMLLMKRWADVRYREDVNIWPVAWVVGVVLLSLWILLWVRLAPE